MKLSDLKVRIKRKLLIVLKNGKIVHNHSRQIAGTAAKE